MQCRRWELTEAAAQPPGGTDHGDEPSAPLVATCARTWKAHPLPINDMQVDSTGGLLVR